MLAAMLGAVAALFTGKAKAAMPMLRSKPKPLGGRVVTGTTKGKRDVSFSYWQDHNFWQDDDGTWLQGGHCYMLIKLKGVPAKQKYMDELDRPGLVINRTIMGDLRLSSACIKADIASMRELCDLTEDEQECLTWAEEIIAGDHSESKRLIHTTPWDKCA